ncbi:MAG: carbohydrate kinase family protein [Acidobacteria bacterium]|nr:carbohydrate kinase family protein [Acidobacteriota bacterium]
MKIKKLKSPSDTFNVSFPTGKKYEVVGFGLNSVDHLCVVPEYPHVNTKTEIVQYKKLPGGQVATAILFLSRLGCHAHYMGKVGDDDLGRLVLDSFESESLDISSILIEKNVPTQSAFIIIDGKSGERTILWQRNEKLNYGRSELDMERICNGKILHLDGYDSRAAIIAASKCREEGIPVSIDLDMVVTDCDALMDTVDFLIVSSDFSREYTGITDVYESFRSLRNSFNGFLVMTAGASGALVSVAGECLAFPGIKVPAVDTTGAGDIFHGAFIYGLLQNWPLDRIMAFSNTAAGLSCGYLGAQSGIRPLDEILRWFKKTDLFSFRRF